MSFPSGIDQWEVPGGYCWGEGSGVDVGGDFCESYLLSVWVSVGL